MGHTPMVLLIEPFVSEKLHLLIHFKLELFHEYCELELHRRILDTSAFLIKKGGQCILTKQKWIAQEACMIVPYYQTTDHNESVRIQILHAHVCITQFFLWTSRSDILEISDVLGDVGALNNHCKLRCGYAHTQLSFKQPFISCLLCTSE